MAKHDVELVVLVDDGGNYTVGIDLDSAQEAWDNDIGGAWHRQVKVKMAVEVPEPVEICVDIPATQGAVTLTATGS